MPYSRCCLTADELDSLLREDAPFGDLTTASLSIGKHPADIHFAARDPMVVCGIEEAVRLFELAGAASVTQLAVSGERADPGRRLLSANGPADALFLAWKVAQSLVESLSGVTTCTQRLVDQAENAVVACTRKHLPGTKTLMVKAIRAGGGIMHRLGLSESIMVTAEHRLFLNDRPTHAYLADIRHRQAEKKCIVEVDSVDAALSLIEQGCDVIQLEKLSPPDVARVVAAASALPAPSKPVIAAAGGINPENVAEYAATGVELLITSAPYFAKPRDVQVTFEAQ
ncbi:MAG: ModD protein [Candidatus Thiodiazotropha sp.]|jgi:molybdenum transport protein